jgi:DnaJ-class molecular chaperone
MTPAQAQAKWEKCLEVIEKLAEEFPCPECEGQGGSEGHDVPYPEPCTECWGRGFQIPDEENE